MNDQVEVCTLRKNLHIFKINANNIISFVSQAVKNIKIGQKNSNLLQFAV